MVTLELLNTTFIEEGASAYIPIEFYVMLIVIAFLFFFLSIMVRQSDDINGILATIFFSVCALLTPSVQLITIGYQQAVTTPNVIPTAYHPYIPYLAYVWLLMFFVCIVNIYRIWSQNLKEAGENRPISSMREMR
jgi:hypothetical protein